MDVPPYMLYRNRPEREKLDAILAVNTVMRTRKAAKSRERMTRQQRKMKNAEIARQFYANKTQQLRGANSFSNIAAAVAEADQEAYRDDLALAIAANSSICLNGSNDAEQREEQGETSNQSNHDMDPDPCLRLLCVVCQEKEKRIMLEPCHHVCLCEACAKKLLKLHSDEGNRLLCPLCRASVSSLVTVHL